MLRLVVRREPAVQVIYPKSNARGAEASVEQPSNPTLRAESPRSSAFGAPPLAQFGSGSHCSSAVADEGIHLASSTAEYPEDVTDQAFIQDRSFIQQSSDAVAITSDDEAEDVGEEALDSEVLRRSASGHVDALNLFGLNVLWQRFR